MKRPIKILLIVLLPSVIVGGVALAQLRGPAAQEGRQALLTRWQYGLLMVGDQDQELEFRTAERRTTFSPPLNSPTGVDRRREPTGQEYGAASVEQRDPFTGVLDSLGEQGWEAFDTQLGGGEYSYIVFMRRKY